MIFDIPHRFQNLVAVSYNLLQLINLSPAKINSPTLNILRYNAIWRQRRRAEEPVLEIDGSW